MGRSGILGPTGLVTGGLVAGGLAAGLAVAQAGPGITGLGPVRRALFPRLAGQGDPGHVALTFDDGPDPAATPKFLDLLADRQVSATFFLLGRMVARSPGLAAELAAAGHEVGVHGWEHRYLPPRGPRATFDDLHRATEIITRAAGTRPRLFRPPYGVLSGAALLAARRLGLTPVLWGAWGREWRPGATPDSVYASLSGRLRGGVTVLLHDSDCTSPPGSWSAALGALPRLLDECSRRGLAVGPLGQHGSTGTEGADGQSCR
jgi:peptidoglycan/xylan/chitin deacetylase (PgdA/CDA1 family)